MRNTLLIITCGLALSACTTFTPITETKPIGLTSNQLKQIQSVVTKDFHDPESAQFKNVRQVDVTLKDGTKERRICGEVNGKNLYGAYVGYKTFGGTMTENKFTKKDFYSPCEPW